MPPSPRLASPPSPGHYRSVSAALLSAAVLSRVLSYQLTYFFSLSSPPLAPVYKPLPAEDVEYSAWKIDGHSPQAAEKKPKPTEREREKERDTRIGLDIVAVRCR